LNPLDFASKHSTFLTQNDSFEAINLFVSIGGGGTIYVQLLNIRRDYKYYVVHLCIEYLRVYTLCYMQNK
jgi:hypothetical protein